MKRYSLISKDSKLVDFETAKSYSEVLRKPRFHCFVSPSLFLVSEVLLCRRGKRNFGLPQDCKDFLSFSAQVNGDVLSAHVLMSMAACGVKTASTKPTGSAMITREAHDARHETHIGNALHFHLQII